MFLFFEQFRLVPPLQNGFGRGGYFAASVRDAAGFGNGGFRPGLRPVYPVYPIKPYPAQVIEQKSVFYLFLFFLLSGFSCFFAKNFWGWFTSTFSDAWGFCRWKPLCGEGAGLCGGSSRTRFGTGLCRPAGSATGRLEDVEEQASSFLGSLQSVPRLKRNPVSYFSLAL